MQYVPLRKLFYKNKDLYNEVLNQRLSSHDTYFFPIKIKAYRSKKEYPAFLVPTWEMSRMIEDIGKSLFRANCNFTRLPGVAQRYYIVKCLINEIQTTNDIEGVYSTKHEIRDTLASIDKEKSLRKKRFPGMVAKYNKLIDPEYVIPLSSSKDIRVLYDDIVKDEISTEKQPDGNIFRADTVYVVSKTQQIRHEGVNPEERIIDYIDNAIAVLHATELPVLVRIAAFHYFFGYIHPFYDGNGRISRFISSYLLSKEVDTLIAYDLSYIIKKNRSEYYLAFRMSNEEKNHGDITPFVITFLSFVQQSAEYIDSNLQEGVERLDTYHEIIWENEFLHNGKENKAEKNLLWYFVQNALFSSDPFTMGELMSECGRSRNGINKLIDVLINAGIPIIMGKDGRNITYSLDIDAFDNKYLV